MAASRQPVTSTSPCHPRLPRLLVSPATPTGPHVYLIATKIWYRLKRFSGTKCHNIHIWFRIKRFLGTIYYENGAWPRPAWRFFCGTPADAERVVCFAPRRRWCLWRFASLIPSGCRLTPVHKERPLKKKLELKDRENRVFEHDSTFFTFRLNNRFSESYFYR